MKPVEIFGIIVRTIGLLVLVPSSLSCVYGLFGALLGGPAATIGVLVFSVPAILIGVWMLRGAPFLVELAYPGSRPRAPETRREVAELDFSTPEQ